MKIYLIAGEDSGDLHGSNFLKALQQAAPGTLYRGVGGEKMREQGMELVAHIRDINFMGFWEVIKNLGTIRRLFRTVKADIQTWKPDAVVLIDYPGFNLRMAKFIQKLGIKVFYYISPQLWAWKKGRVKTIRQYVDRMWVILPFEEAFYAKEGVAVDFVGHPLLDVIGTSGEQEKALPDQPVIALLPGSRKQEIQRMLPTMLQVIDHFPEAKFVIAGAPSQPEAFYRQLIGDQAVTLEMNRTYEVLQSADAAVVTSGTATLETALLGVPEVVVYKGSPISYWIGKRLVKVKFISLVNLILDRPAVKELIQHDYTPDQVAAELRRLLDPDLSRQVRQDYIELRTKLGDVGASARAAELLLAQIAAK